MRQKDVFQYKQFSIQQTNAAMKVGTDSDLLGTLAEGGERILDIGTGTGILSLMLAQRYPTAQVTAIEIDDDAILDAQANIEASPFRNRIQLIHLSFQEYLAQMQEQGLVEIFDSVVCNPPYFDKSLESTDLGRTRARHTSSLPFSVLILGAYALLKEDGVFSVCIPPEVLSDFTTESFLSGFWMKDLYKIKSVPEKAPKRYVLVQQKGQVACQEHVSCMRNSDRTVSDWYRDLLKDFHL